MACTNRYTDAKSIRCRLSGCHTATVQPVFVLALHALCLGVATILITRPPVKGCDNSTHQFFCYSIGRSDGLRADLGCPLTVLRNSNYLTPMGVSPPVAFAFTILLPTIAAFSPPRGFIEIIPLHYAREIETYAAPILLDPLRPLLGCLVSNRCVDSMVGILP